MLELIEALQIFATKGDIKYPIQCDHDELHVYGYDWKDFSAEQLARLSAIGFFWSIEYQHFYSFRYGSS